MLRVSRRLPLLAATTACGALLLLACQDSDTTAATTDADASATDTGAADVPAAGGWTTETLTLTPGATITVEVPEDALSFVVVLEGDGAGASVALDGLTAPDGTELITSSATGGGLTAPYVTSPGRGATTLMVPQNDVPSLQVQPGTWTLKPAVTDGTLAAATVTFLRGPSEPTAGTVDLHLIIGSDALSGLSAATVSEHAGLADALGVLDDILASADLTVGQVTATDAGTLTVDGGIMTDFLPDVQALLTTWSPEAPAGAVTVVLADALPETLHAMAGGIPAAHDVPGTTASGIVLDLTKHTSDADAAGETLGRSLAQMLSLSLGLFQIAYIQPFGDPVYDPIADTPECASAADCSANVTGSQIDATGSPLPTFSATQGRIVRLNPIVHPTAD